MVNTKKVSPRCEATAKMLQALRPHAVIDWIEIEVAFDRSTNFTAVQNALKEGLRTERTSWVIPLNEGPGGAATRFLIKIVVADRKLTHL